MRWWKRGDAVARAGRNWNWTFWVAILAFEAVGVLLSTQA